MRELVVNEVVDDSWNYQQLQDFMVDLSLKSKWKWIGTKMLSKDVEKKSDWLMEKPISLSDGTQVYLWRWWSAADIDRFLKALSTVGKEVECIKTGE